MSHQAECCYQSAAVNASQAANSAATVAVGGGGGGGGGGHHHHSSNSNNGGSINMTRMPVAPANVFSPLERLEAMSTDYDMLKPLLMFNIENIQTYRADCKYRKARK